MFNGFEFRDWLLNFKETNTNIADPRIKFIDLNIVFIPKMRSLKIKKINS